MGLSLVNTATKSKLATIIKKYWSSLKIRVRHKVNSVVKVQGLI